MATPVAGAPKQEHSLQSMLIDANVIEQTTQALDFAGAQEAIVVLTNKGESIAREFFSGNNELRSPLPIALKVLEILSQDHIQLEMELKTTLSKVCRVFFEVTLVKARLSGTSIYNVSKENIINAVEKVESSLPKSAVELALNLKCIKAVGKALEAPYPFKTALKEALKAGINMELGNLVETVHSAWRGRSQAGGWFADLLLWRWIALKVNTAEDLQTLSDMIGETKHAKPKAQIYTELLERAVNEQLESALIDKVLDQVLPLLKSKEWQARLFGTNQLSAFIRQNIPRPQDESTSPLVDELSKERANKIFIELTSLLCSESDCRVLMPVATLYKIVSDCYIDQDNLNPWKSIIRNSNLQGKISFQIEKIKDTIAKGKDNKVKVDRALANQSKKIVELRGSITKAEDKKAAIRQQSAGESRRLALQISNLQQSLEQEKLGNQILLKKSENAGEELGQMETLKELLNVFDFSDANA